MEAPMTPRVVPFAAADAARPPLQIRLFGQFSVRAGDRLLTGLRAAKVQELLGYLLVHRGRPHARESLAALLWGDVPTAASRKYLRHALWQLQANLGDGSSAGALLLIESDSIRVNPAAEVWIDVAEFDSACDATRDLRCESMDEHTYGVLRRATALYRGDLLDGWYREWCLAERERLQTRYLALVDTLMGYCAVHGRFDEGVSVGLLSLRYDRARERTHQHLMRLQALAGDRTGALRQYQRCTAALQQELGVEPAEATRNLCRQIGMGQLDGRCDRAPSTAGTDLQPAALLSDVLGRLKHVQIVLADLQRRVQEDTERCARALADPVRRETPPRALQSARRGESQKHAAR
jgi:DNA-binding SARP family transcriptional activator